MPPRRFWMKAVIIDEFGSPEVLRLGDREMPEPDAGQVRVRVRAAGVNGVDAAIRSGAAQQIFPTKLPTVLGLEIAGVVDASGPNVDGLAVARGATVIGTASEPNHDYLREIGATPVVYGEGLVDRVRAVAPDGIDAVFDAAGQGALPDSIELRGGTSRIVTIADPAAFGL